MSKAKTFLQDMPDFSKMVEATKNTAAAAADDEKHRQEMAACVEAAYVVASADGKTSSEEIETIAGRIEDLTGGAITIAITGLWLGSASAKVEELGRDGLIADIAARLDSDAKRQAGFMVAANASWKGGGIGVQEGLALQALSKAFGWEMSYMHKQLALARS